MTTKGYEVAGIRAGEIREFRNTEFNEDSPLDRLNRKAQKIWAEARNAYVLEPLVNVHQAELDRYKARKEPGTMFWFWVEDDDYTDDGTAELELHVWGMTPEEWMEFYRWHMNTVFTDDANRARSVLSRKVPAWEEWRARRDS